MHPYSPETKSEFNGMYEHYHSVNWFLIIIIITGKGTKRLLALASQKHVCALIWGWALKRGKVLVSPPAGITQLLVPKV